MSAQTSTQLCDFKTLAPQNSSTQEASWEWIVRAHTQAEIKKSTPSFDSEKFSARLTQLLRHVACSPQKIKQRAHELSDFTHFDWERMKIFNFHKNGEAAGTQARSEFFAQSADRVFAEFYENDSTAPAGIIHVTCTGYVSPSGAQKLVEKKAWNQNTQVTHAYHMGCYAAVPATRLAEAMLASKLSKKTNERVDIVHTELCSLHFDPSDHTAEQLVIQSLFADGLIRYSARQVAPGTPGGFDILAVREEIVPHSAHAMSWSVGDHGMKMNLSREVPTLIGEYLNVYLQRLFNDAGLDFHQKRSTAEFAIHPGGPKIIERSASLLELRKDQTRAAQNVLYNYGNMSSATLPFIWKDILADEEVRAGTLIVSLAFGPGLTIAGSLMRKC